ncbi:hypothetical protein C8R43DRAFT_947993 [Mycena crocata]|nr:hypothetical protein C8R43DRAFT_947993 [Mycena crocata]
MYCRNTRVYWRQTSCWDSRHFFQTTALSEFGQIHEEQNDDGDRISAMTFSHRIQPAAHTASPIDPVTNTDSETDPDMLVLFTPAPRRHPRHHRHMPNVTPPSDPKFSTTPYRGPASRLNSQKKKKKKKIPDLHFPATSKSESILYEEGPIDFGIGRSEFSQRTWKFQCVCLSAKIQLGSWRTPIKSIGLDLVQTLRLDTNPTQRIDSTRRRRERAWCGAWSAANGTALPASGSNDAAARAELTKSNMEDLRPEIHGASVLRMRTHRCASRFAAAAFRRPELGQNPAKAAAHPDLNPPVPAAHAQHAADVPVILGARHVEHSMVRAGVTDVVTSAWGNGSELPAGMSQDESVRVRVRSGSSRKHVPQRGLRGPLRAVIIPYSPSNSKVKKWSIFGL